MEWKTCTSCGRSLPTVEMAEHETGCRAAPTPSNRMISPADMENRSVRYPAQDPDELFRQHRAHINRLKNEAERIK